jgi:hypothetical protein
LKLVIIYITKIGIAGGPGRSLKIGNAAAAEHRGIPAL